MSLWQIALNNLNRRRTKMLFLMLGLMVGVATVVGLLTIVLAMRLELGDRIDEFGANIVIVPRSEGATLNYGGIHVPGVAFNVQRLTEADLPQIDTIEERPAINIISPKIVGSVETGGQKVMLVGVETKREFTQKPWFSLQEQAGLAPGEKTGSLALLDIPTDGLVLGSSAAQALRVRAGEELALNGRPFQVFGILSQTGGREDGLLYANLPVVQQLLGRPGEFSMIEISAYCNFCPVEEIAAQLAAVLPNARVMPLRQAALFREETIDRFESFGFALSGVILLVAALMVLTTMLSSVSERTREIGIFRAIGFRRAHVMKIIFLEAGMVSFLGGIFGYLLGSISAQLAGPFLVQIDLAQVTGMPLRTDLILPAVLLSMLLAVAASAYPALKAAKLDPAEALRFI
ncbi:MAG: FtsX-like permease family protein [Firmicutes bacterium]|nr:FtsX-like permease family protein [Bacillota bacterium]